MRNKFFLLLVLAAATALITAGMVYSSATAAIQASEPVFYTVHAGSSVSSVAQELEARGIIPSAFAFRLMARIKDLGPIQAADYEFKPGMSVWQLYKNMVEGKSLSPERQITLVEGWTLDQMAEALAAEGIIGNAQAFIDAATKDSSRFATDFTFLADKPDEASLEGYLFPDTYRFFPQSEPDAVITRLLANFQAKVTPAIQQHIKDSGRTMHEAIVLASIVEREVRSPEEMRVVAGIFANRLEVGMALQADSTVNYLTKSGRDRSTYEDISIDSPYNTYKYAGLPPGPISNPGLNAIAAAAQPGNTEYFYFLTDDEGRVYYGKTLDEHNRNREKYL